MPNSEDIDQQADLAGDIVLSQSDPRPMYQQILERIQQLVAAGQWAPGQEIPSIRQLAVALRVSLITIRRAYRELEREGVIATRHGKGSVVAESPDLSSRLRRSELDSLLERAVRLAEILDLTEDELVEELRKKQTENDSEGVGDERTSHSYA